VSSSFLNLTLPMYQRLNHELSHSFDFSPTYLVSCMHIKLVFILVILSTTSIDFHVRVFIFHVSKQIIILWTNFFTLVCSRRCGNWEPLLIVHCIQTTMQWRLLVYHCTRAIQRVVSKQWPNIHTILYSAYVIEIR